MLNLLFLNEIEVARDVVEIDVIGARFDRDVISTLLAASKGERHNTPVVGPIIVGCKLEFAVVGYREVPENQLWFSLPGFNRVML